MSWTHVKTLNLPSAPSEAASNGKLWLIRGKNYVAQVNPNKLEVNWIHPISLDYTFGYEPIVLFEDVVVFAAHRNSEPDEVWLHALNCHSGESLWQRAVNWRAFDYLTGLLVAGGELMLIEHTDSVPRLLLISPLTGQIISQTKAAVVQGAGINSRVDETAVYVANKAFFLKKRKGIYMFDDLKEQEKFKLILSANVKAVAGEGDNFYYSQHPFDLFWLDGATAQQKGKVAVPTYPRKIIAPAQARGNVLILFTRKRGLARVDFHIEKCCWHVGKKDKWEVFQAVWTSAGIIADVKAEKRELLVSLDEATGKVKATPPRPSGRLTGLLYWTGQYLLIGTQPNFEDKLEIFIPS